MVEFINNKVVIIPNAKKFFSDISKKEIPDLIEYLYYYYDKDSPLAFCLPKERRMLCLEKLPNDFKLEKYSQFIIKYENIVLSQTDKLALSISKRIEKIIQKLDEDDIVITDLKKEADVMSSLTDIFKLQDILNERLAKETNTKQMKGSKKSSPFEETII